MQNNFARVLVTGGAGFIGSHIVEELLKTEVKEIIIFDNFMRGCLENLKSVQHDNRVKIIEKHNDITNYQDIYNATKGIDCVFHLASLCLSASQENPRLGFDINVKGTFSLLESCLINNVKKIIFSSSSSIYGDAVYTPMDESHPFNNRNFYGAFKICGEEIIKAFYYKYAIPYLNLRYMNVYGPRQDYLGAYVAIIVKIIDKLQKNEPLLIYGDGTQRFDFIYVKDVAEANIIAMNSSIANQSYNISTGVQTSINDLSSLLMGLMNVHTYIQYTENIDHTLVNDRIGSTKKAFDELGFRAKTPLKEGLINTILWKLNR